MTTLIMLACSVLSTAATPAAPSIIFRLDGVQDWLATEATQLVVQAFHAEGEPFALSVQGGMYFGQDPAMVSAVESAVASGCEVVNAGPGHALSSDVSEAISQIKDSEVDAFRPYSTFAAGEADINKKALNKAGYHTISTVQTAGHAAAQPIEACVSSIAEHGFCVVALDAMTFNDADRHALSMWIQSAKANNWKVTTFRDAFPQQAAKTATCSRIAAPFRTCHKEGHCCQTGFECTGSSTWATCLPVAA